MLALPLPPTRPIFPTAQRPIDNIDTGAPRQHKNCTATQIGRIGQLRHALTTDTPLRAHLDVSGHTDNALASYSTNLAPPPLFFFNPPNPSRRQKTPPGHKMHRNADWSWWRIEATTGHLYTAPSTLERLSPCWHCLCPLLDQFSPPLNAPLTI